LYSADGSGRGAPSGSIRRVHPNGGQSTEPFTNGQTISLNGDQVWLHLRA
jgi:hypothetical protein